MAALSTSSESAPPPPPVEFTQEEMSTIMKVKEQLIAGGLDPARISPRELALTTLNSKLRVDDACEKYIAWLDAIAVFGLKSFDEVWAEVKQGDWSLVGPLLRSYAVCGRDGAGRSIMWIKGGGIRPEDEAVSVRAGVLYFLAIHADSTSMHDGITFVIDTSTSNTTYGNEKQLQRVWQAFPLRPQRIFIAGASMVKRVVINGLIKFASLFVKAKVLGRIEFADMDRVLEEVPMEGAPQYVGGNAGGNTDILEWTRQRLEAWPAPDI